MRIPNVMLSTPMPVTQKNIAEKVGVSQSLVARALKGYPHIADETQSRILEAARELGYDIHANSEARALAARRHGRRGSGESGGEGRDGEAFSPSPRALTGLIGLVGNAFSPQGGATLHWVGLVEGVQDVLGRAERRVVLLDNASTFGWDNVDGVLVLDRRITRLPLWAAPSLDCVSLLNRMPGFTSVVAADREGGKAAVRHLVGLGHRRIAFLMEEGMEIPLLRLQGYREALREATIEAEGAWVECSPIDLETAVGVRSNPYVAWGRLAMERWLQNGWAQAGCTALVAQNDGVAVGAMLALQAQGVDVPGQVSIVGFDGADDYEHFSPSLSSVEIPLRDLGATAAQVLIGRIIKRHNGRTAEASPVEFPAEIVLPTGMKIRRSTASRPVFSSRNENLFVQA